MHSQCTPLARKAARDQELLSGTGRKLQGMGACTRFARRGAALGGSACYVESTEDAGRPFWSPDSRSLAFFAGSQLKRIALAGGLPTVLTDEPGRDVAWSADGVMLIGGGNRHSKIRLAPSELLKLPKASVADVAVPRS